MTSKHHGKRARRTAGNETISRRRFLAGSAAAAGLAVAGPLILTPGRARAQGSVSFASDGGRPFEIMTEIWLKPFEQKTGIKTIPIPTTRNVSMIKAQVETRNVEWDLVGLGGGPTMVAIKDGLLEPIDKSVVNLANYAFPEWIYPMAVAAYYYTGGIVYRPSTHGAPGKHPRTWPQYWDVQGIPGRRGMRARPQEEMERALIADGVKPKDLYPLDEARAFKSLDRIKPHVKNWIKDTPQTITLLQSKEIDFVYTYVARVVAAKAQGLDMEFVFDSPISTPYFYFVLKGSKNKDAAMRLLDHFLAEDVQREWAIRSLNGPVNKKAAASLPPATAANIAKFDNPNHVLIDVKYWADNLERLEARYVEWLTA